MFKRLYLYLPFIGLVPWSTNMDYMVNRGGWAVGWEGKIWYLFYVINFSYSFQPVSLKHFTERLHMYKGGAPGFMELFEEFVPKFYILPHKAAVYVIPSIWIWVSVLMSIHLSVCPCICLSMPLWFPDDNLKTCQ